MQKGDADWEPVNTRLVDELIRLLERLLRERRAQRRGAGGVGTPTVVERARETRGTTSIVRTPRLPSSEIAVPAKDEASPDVE